MPGVPAAMVRQPAACAYLEQESVRASCKFCRLQGPCCESSFCSRHASSVSWCVEIVAFSLTVWVRAQVRLG